MNVVERIIRDGHNDLCLLGHVTLPARIVLPAAVADNWRRLSEAPEPDLSQRQQMAKSTASPNAATDSTAPGQTLQWPPPTVRPDRRHAVWPCSCRPADRAGLSPPGVRRT